MDSVTYPRPISGSVAPSDAGTVPSVPEAGAEDGFFLPELPRLLPAAYHPKAAQIEFQSNGWLARMLSECFVDEQALLAFLRQRNGLYGSMTVPATDEARARNITDFYHYFAALDDAAADRSSPGHSQARAALARITASFGTDSGADDDSAYVRAAGDWWRRIAPDLTASQTQRFRDSVETGLRGSAAELPYRLTGTVPDLDSYLNLRVDSFGFEFMLLLTEYAAAIDMTDLRPSLEFTTLHGHAVRQLIMVNDVLSWRREHALGDTINAVAVLCRHEGMTFQEAVDTLCGLIEQHETAYIAARDGILQGPLGARADVRTYLDALDHLIGGSQEFEYLTPRYYGDGYVWDGSTSGWISFTAPVARFRPSRDET
jgi:hypothetical protein